MNVYASSLASHKIEAVQANAAIHHWLVNWMWGAEWEQTLRQQVWSVGNILADFRSLISSTSFTPSLLQNDPAD